MLRAASPLKVIQYIYTVSNRPKHPFFWRKPTEKMQTPHKKSMNPTWELNQSPNHQFTVDKFAHIFTPQVPLPNIDSVISQAKLKIDTKLEMLHLTESVRFWRQLGRDKENEFVSGVISLHHHSEREKKNIFFPSPIAAAAAVKCNAVTARLFIYCLRHMKYSSLRDVIFSFCTLISWERHISTSSPITFPWLEIRLDSPPVRRQGHESCFFWKLWEGKEWLHKVDVNSRARTESYRYQANQ